MKKTILLVLALMMVSCTGGQYIKEGTAVTIEGDTIVFYGGTIQYHPEGWSTNISRIHVKR